MRLIDSDALLKGRVENDPIRIAVMNEPTAYDIDRVVEQLEQQKDRYVRRSEEIKHEFGENFTSQKYYAKACSYGRAIEIIKAGLNKILEK